MMFRLLTVLSILTIVGFASCKKTISKKACFTMSNTSPKAGDTVFLFNCSEGYNRCRWILPTGAIDTNRNTFFQAGSAATYGIMLTIGDNLFIDTANEIKTFTVNP